MTPGAPPATGARTVLPSDIGGTLVAPPSKSVMLRVLAASLLGEGLAARITNPSFCEDSMAGLRVIETLGAEVERVSGEVIVRGGLRPRGTVLDCGESGLCLRMFAAVAALTGGEFTLTGRGSLLARPAAGVETTLASLGARCRTRDGHPPLVIRGPLRGGEATVDGRVSSQHLSGLLLALPAAERDSTLHVRDLASRPYVDLTLSLLARFGVRVERDGYSRFHLAGGQRHRVGDFRIEGDWSAAAFLLVAGAVGGRLRVTGLDPASLQADRRVLDALHEAGAGVAEHPDGAEAARGRLRGFRFDATDSPDLFPPLAALACHCEGTTVLRGVNRLRHKESDRAAALAREFSGLGIRVETQGDDLAITGGPVRGGRAESHGDHRVAMAVAVAAVAARGPVRIEGAEHVGKSYPRFFADLAAAGGRVDG